MFSLYPLYFVVPVSACFQPLAKYKILHNFAKKKVSILQPLPPPPWEFRFIPSSVAFPRRLLYSRVSAHVMVEIRIRTATPLRLSWELEIAKFYCVNERLHSRRRMCHEQSVTWNHAFFPHSLPQVPLKYFATIMAMVANPTQATTISAPRISINKV